MKEYEVMVITPTSNRQFKITVDEIKTTCDGIYEFIKDNETIAFLPVKYTVIVLVK